MSIVELPLQRIGQLRLSPMTISVVVKEEGILDATLYNRLLQTVGLGYCYKILIRPNLFEVHTFGVHTWVTWAKGCDLKDTN